MSFEDKTIQCVDCKTNFTFTSGEQEFFSTKGFTNEPKRCPECRRANKARRSDSGNSNNTYASRY
jgi:hypothetical protein